MPDLGARGGALWAGPLSATGAAGAHSLDFCYPSGICRVCGCTQDNACIDPGGEPCIWIDVDLCSECADEPEVEVMLCHVPRNPETRQALEALIQAAARVLVSQPADSEARRAKPVFQGFHESRDTRHESRPLSAGGANGI